MLRASKTLLCALLADVSLASRQTGTVVNVIDSIGSLMQKHKSSASSAVDAKVLSNLRLLASITPGQSDSLNTALTKVIADITADVDSKIINGFAGTQSSINTKISDLDLQTKVAVEKKVAADNADTVWFNCVDKERELRINIEAANAAEISSRSNSLEACQVEEDSRGFEQSITLTKFTCDISQNQNCNEQVANYRTVVEGMVTSLTSDFEGAQKVHNDAHLACVASQDDLASKQSAHSDLQVDWNSKRSECRANHETRQVSMCTFGTSLQNKCTRKTAYDTLIAEVDMVNGGEHSQPDREQEWTTTSVTKCMLQKVIDGGAIDAATMDACHLDVKFATQVGVLDRQTTQYNALTTEDKFTCSETTISFAKTTQWNVPQDAEPASEDYTRTAFSPPVDLNEMAPPFSWCAGAGPPCVGKGC